MFNITTATFTKPISTSPTHSDNDKNKDKDKTGKHDSVWVQTSNGYKLMRVEK